MAFTMLPKLVDKIMQENPQWAEASNLVREIEVDAAVDDTVKSIFKLSDEEFEALVEAADYNGEVKYKFYSQFRDTLWNAIYELDETA